MQDAEKQLEDIAEIRTLMERSAKFLSLSGLSGISAGCTALAGGAFGHWYVMQRGGYVPGDGDMQRVLTIDAGAVLIVALALAYFFTRRMARKKGLPVWNKTVRYMFKSLLTPIGSGAILAVIFTIKGLFAYAVPSTLIFYGLGLTDASKFTLNEVWYLGLAEILLGLAGMVFPFAAPWLWAAGFGLMHVVYGIVMYYRYER